MLCLQQEHLCCLQFFGLCPHNWRLSPTWIAWKTVKICHVDVIKWKHFLRYWSFVGGIHRWPMDSPHKGQWRKALMLSSICAWTNGLASNRDAGDLRLNQAHYDVTAMSKNENGDTQSIIRKRRNYVNVNGLGHCTVLSIKSYSQEKSFQRKSTRKKRTKNQQEIPLHYSKLKYGMSFENTCLTVAHYILESAGSADKVNSHFSRIAFVIRRWMLEWWSDPNMTQTGRRTVYLGPISI